VTAAKNQIEAAKVEPLDERRKERQALPVVVLDARQTLWGSQKCYTAQELKTLINRVRTQHPAVHLPLVVIPETGDAEVAESLGSSLPQASSAITRP
jgi:ADP-heptose:LPS heptosyltransferase